MGDPRERGHSARPLGRKAYSYSSVSSRSKSNSSRRSESALSRDISELVRVVDNRLSNPSKASTRTSVTNFSSTLRSNASASVSAVTVPGVGRRRGRMQRRCSVSFSSVRSGEVRPSLRLATASSSSRLGSLKPTLLGLKSLCGFQRRRAAYSVANPAHFLSVRSGWLLRLAETFDLRVSFSRGNEAGDPLWTVSGSIPLGSEAMVLDTPVKSGDSVEPSPRRAQIPHTVARPRGPT
jgi:hypothetical protein